MKVTWLQKLEKEKHDSIWYGGDMVRIETDKYICVVVAEDNITIEINNCRFKDKNNTGTYIPKILNENGIYNDNDLKRALNSGSLEMLDNNWFEIIVFDKNTREYINDWDNIVGLQEDLEEVKKYINELEDY